MLENEGIFVAGSVSKIANRNSFALEPLEPRVLLSGVPLSPNPAGSDTQEATTEAVSVAIAETVEQQLVEIQSAPVEARIDDIFEGVSQSVFEPDGTSLSGTQSPAADPASTSAITSAPPVTGNDVGEVSEVEPGPGSGGFSSRRRV